MGRAFTVSALATLAAERLASTVPGTAIPPGNAGVQNALRLLNPIKSPKPSEQESGESPEK